MTLSVPLDLFAIVYFGGIAALIALFSGLLETRLRKLLFGLCTGVIAAAALPFVKMWLG